MALILSKILDFVLKTHFDSYSVARTSRKYKMTVSDSYVTSLYVFYVTFKQAAYFIQVV